MRRRVESLFIIAALVCGVVYLDYQLKMSRQRLRSNSCQSNLRQLALAMGAYTQDCGEFPRVAYAEKLGSPFGSLGPYYGWADATQPYIKCYTCFQCFEEPHGPNGDPRLPLYIDFWINRNVAGQQPQKVSTPHLTLLIGDGNDGSDRTDARYSLSQFPPAWLAQKDSPMFRHMGGANYLFVDGHVKWLKPNEVKSFGNRPNPFALR